MLGTIYSRIQQNISYDLSLDMLCLLKLLDDLKERRGYSHLKEEALDHTMWRNRFGRGFGPVVRQNTE
jgi:hypothetical protein